MIRLCFLLAFVLSGFGCKDGSAFGAGRPYVKPVKPPRGLTPAPLLSRGKTVKSSKRISGADKLTDGKYKASSWEAGTPSADSPAWVALELGPGPQKLLLSWTSSGSFNHRETTYGGPGSYRIEVSKDGDEWKPVVTVTDNEYRTRAHGFDFTGNSWVRLVITGPSKDTNKYGVKLDELELHDISTSADDTWFFLGDSVTAFAFARAATQQPSFAELIAKKHPGHTPMMLNGGQGFEKSSDGLKKLPDLLQQHPEVHFWAIGYGTNDAAGNQADPSGFERNLEEMIALVKGAGRVPVLARIPWAKEGHDNVPQFNAVIDALNAKHALTPGPDLYAHFKAHPQELSDGLHPNDAGIVSINRLWAAAVDSLY